MYQLLLQKQQINVSAYLETCDLSCSWNDCQSCSYRPSDRWDSIYSSECIYKGVRDSGGLFTWAGKASLPFCVLDLILAIQYRPSIFKPNQKLSVHFVSLRHGGTGIHVGQRIWQPVLTGRAWERWKGCSSFHTFLKHLKKSLLSWNPTPFGPCSIQYGKQREHLRDSNFIWWFKRCFWIVLGYTMSFCFPTFQEEKARKHLIAH